MSLSSRSGVTSGTVVFLLAACGQGGRDALPRNAGDAGAIANAADFARDGGVSGTTDACEAARQTRSYVGCEYWPTVTPNPVWSIFDFAVVVANLGTDTAEVTISGPGGTNVSRSVAGGATDVVTLPWVRPLKGTDASSCGTPQEWPTSVLAHGAAYHLVSSRPVVAYQFNPLEYAPQGGAPGKDWSKCPNSPLCASCFSYSNDASLLLPTPALASIYRISAARAPGTTVTVTATQDGTKVDFHVGKNGRLVAGGGVTAAGPGEVSSVTLDAGDVAQFFAEPNADVSGSIVSATAPVEVIVGNQCIFLPDSNTHACDHVEEVAMPAETLGKRHVVPRPPSPSGGAVTHVVRITGNVDGTTLAYEPKVPAGCPTKLDAGESVQCTVTDTDFVVTGSSEIVVSTFLVGSEMSDPSSQRGDPSQSFAAPVEQYRKDYVFLAPLDYDLTYAVITTPMPPPSITLDGTPVATAPTPIGASGLGVLYVPIPKSTPRHRIEAGAPVGAQIVGYGSYTSYAYPAGLDLTRIAPPPVVK